MGTLSSIDSIRCAVQRHTAPWCTLDTYARQPLTRVSISLLLENLPREHMCEVGVIRVARESPSSLVDARGCTAAGVMQYDTMLEL